MSDGVLRKAARPLAWIALAAACATGFMACSGDEYTQDEEIGCPPSDAFLKNVSPLLERRCGTLDCHGSMYRPMRLYGGLGLRYPAEANISGGVPTTAAELAANYASVCDVEPEPMSQAAQDRGASAEKLLLVNKARGLESHKGGKVVNENDAADRCILSWIRRAPLAQLEADCDAAMQQLE